MNMFKKNTYSEIIVLSTLKNGDKYGFEISSYINNEDNTILHETSLYPTLYHLEEEHYISSYSKIIGKRKKRIYYHMEESGREYLNQIIEEYKAFTNAINIFIENIEKNTTE